MFGRSDQPPAPPFLRRIRLVRRMVCGVAAIGLATFAASRWNGKVAAEGPADDESLQQIEIELDQFERLIVAAPTQVVVDGGTVQLIPAQPKDISDPTAGMPEGSHAYFWHPDVRAWLGDTARQAERLPPKRVPGAIDRRSSTTGWQPAVQNLPLLASRAAFQVDPADAWQGLYDAYRIAGAYERHVRRYRTVVPSVEETLTDVAVNAHYYPLPPDETTRWIERLVADGVHLETALRTELDYVGLDAVLDQYFTRDEDGNGWMVLSRPEPIAARSFLGGPAPGAETWRTSGFWNVFSPLFYDRATARRLILPGEQAIAGCDDRPFDVRLLARDGVDPRLRSSRLGPLRERMISMQGWGMWPTIQTVALRRAVVTILAIEAFRQRTGEYPEELADVAEDLPPIALRSPLEAAPFSYERRGDDYSLEFPPENEAVPASFQIRGFGRFGRLTLRRSEPVENE
jgi:hypothetical protein